MTDGERLFVTRGLLGPSPDTGQLTDEMVMSFLGLAKNAILLRRYEAAGGVPEGADVPGQYQLVQCQLAVRYINRIGTEGEKAHSENGVVRTYGSVDDDDLLSKITPLAGVPV